MIRYLSPGEALPAGSPRRYTAANGYVRLRWKVGTGAYVETYEHRVQDGRVTTAEHVHHRNHDRSDNRPENLVYLTADEHRQEHGSLLPPICTDLYMSGWTTVEIAEDLGINAATVSRALAAAGVRTRPSNFRRVLAVDEAELRRLYDSGMPVTRIAAAMGVSRYVIRSRVKDLGLSRDSRVGQAS